MVAAPVSRLAALLANFAAGADPLLREPLARVVPVGGSSCPAGGCGEAPPTLRVAAVQMADFVDGKTRTSRQETLDRTAKVVKYLGEAAKLGARVAAFPELALARYEESYLKAGTADDMELAEAAVAKACREHNISAIVGIPKYFTPAPGATLPKECTAEKCWWNTALVVNEKGQKIYRQAKMHSAGPDGPNGEWLDTFQIDNVTVSLQICYDAYFVHMSMLPVMKGSRIVFDISSERGYDDDAYFEAVTRGLYNGIAQQTGANVVQSNTGVAFRCDGELPCVLSHRGEWAGSHGNSQILSGGPRSQILARAPHSGEHIVVADVDVSESSHSRLQDETIFKKWWEQGLKLLKPMPVDSEGQMV